MTKSFREVLNVDPHMTVFRPCDRSDPRSEDMHYIVVARRSVLCV